jgi:hypothetical protein
LFHKIGTQVYDADSFFQFLDSWVNLYLFWLWIFDGIAFHLHFIVKVM